MNIDKIINSPLINRNALARLMYPGMNSKTGPGQYLYKKLHNKEGQSFGYADKEKIKEIFKDLFADMI